ncbi:DUF3606 domain-containing protein [soil metagenome]
MSDNLKDKGPQDSSRISTSEKWEIVYWTKALGCSEEELKEAVKAVGNSAEAVKKYFKK